MNINLLSLSNKKKSSHICVKYGSEDVYTAGKSVNCDLTPNLAQFISVAGQRLYTIQRRRPISASNVIGPTVFLRYPLHCATASGRVGPYTNSDPRTTGILPQLGHYKIRHYDRPTRTSCQPDPTII